ncbi:MAG: hypothetical protein LKE40_13045 [Spirochaetia bacterium]|jgi:hypothetical protein|nr:hypothetical protein [Spirochaetia bacterium]
MQFPQQVSRPVSGREKKREELREKLNWHAMVPEGQSRPRMAKDKCIVIFF